LIIGDPDPCARMTPKFENILHILQ
jgi:hypothetical protein